MAQLLVRNLDDGVAERLKVQAAQSGRSLEAEVRAILELAARPSRADLLAEADAIRARSRPWQPGEPTVVDYIREGRDER